MIINKEYSCEDCFHESVCAYKKDMQYYFDKLQKQVNNNNFDIIPTYNTTLQPPIAAYYAIKCNFFHKKGLSIK